MNVLVYTLGAPLHRGPYGSLARWLKVLPTCPFQGSVERAIWGGFHADRLGFAFAAGYEAALARLFEHAGRVQRAPEHKPFPDPPLPPVVALAATEAGGVHPRAIQTRLDKQGGALVLKGEKTFATLASAADEILVVASRGAGGDGRNRLRAVRVPRGAPGMHVEPRPEMPFAPEIPHAIVRFEDCVVEERFVLPGDGYDVWLKPFRTIEDIHVLAATVGYLAGAGRAYAWDREILAELSTLGLGLIDLGARDPLAPLSHLLLAGLFGTGRRLVADLAPQWARASEDERTRWERDVALLRVAETARAKRTEGAWNAIAESVRPSIT